MMDWLASNRRMLVDMVGNGSFNDFSENFYISEVQKDLVTGEETVTITIEHAHWGDTRFTLPRGDINSKIISKMVTYGLTCVDDQPNNEIVAYILLKTEKDAKHVLVHNALGFVTDNTGEDIFLLNHPVKSSDPIKLASAHVDPEKVAPYGELSQWQEDIKKVVVGNPYLELALAIGAMAPIAHILMNKKIITEVPLIALIGNSTTGKTTSLTLMSSIWFDSSMISDFNCTQNAFFEQMAQARGLPMLIDEASAVPSWDFTNTIYNLPKGRSKLRCSSSGKIVTPLKFSGAIIFTGEKSLLEQTAKTRGLEARLLELNLPWTANKKQANDIEKLCRSSYGVAGSHIAEWVIDKQDRLGHIFDYCFEKLTVETANLNLDNVTRRLLKFVAMLMLAGYALNRSLGLGINISGIKNTLIEILKEKACQSIDPDITYFDTVKSVLNSGFYKFTDGKSCCDVGTASGIKKGTGPLWIDKVVFEEIVRKHLPVDIHYVKKYFSEKGWLVRSSDRHYVFPKNICGIRTNCYGINLDSLADYTFPEPSKRKPKKQTKKKSGSKIKDLLKECS